MAEQLPVLRTTRNSSAETWAQISYSTLQDTFHLLARLNYKQNKM